MECLFRGQRHDTHEWVCGFVRHYKDENKYFIEECVEGRDWKVIPETVGEYTGVTEFDSKNEKINKKIFEGDIVEIIIYRGLYGKRTSQYDSLVKVRGAVKKDCARWFIDLENDYNKSLFAAKRNEVYDRNIPNSYFLDNFYLTDEQKERERQTNQNHPFNYIKVIGNIFDNQELLEVKQ